MHDELTEVDIQKMQEEIDQRKARTTALLAEVKRTRDYGDLSENDEYRSAKRELNRNRSRIRYLQAMIDTAIIIKPDSGADVAGLFDAITLRYDDGRQRVVRIVTTLRNDVFQNCISKESPFGQAILGHKLGETVTVKAGARTYDVTIVSIEKGTDDASLPIATH